MVSYMYVLTVCLRGDQQTCLQPIPEAARYMSVGSTVDVTHVHADFDDHLLGKDITHRVRNIILLDDDTVVEELHMRC